MKLVIDGIPVEINRKKIKHMYLYVKPPEGAVSVSAPMRMPRQTIERFVREKRGWIEKRQESYRRQYGTAGTDSADGADGGNSGGPQIRPLDEKDRAFLRKEIAEILPRWEERTGLHCAGFQIRDMKTRWGVCAPAQCRITFAQRLAQQSPAAVVYVAVHELAHFAVPNHSPAFWAVVARVLPDYKARRALLQTPR